MTPAGRLQMTIAILEAAEQSARPLDHFLKQWFSTRRFAGAKDRRAIAGMVFAIQRTRAHLAHRMGSDAPRALAIALAAGQGDDLEALFSGGYGPAPLTADERERLAREGAPMPDWVRGEYPRWLEDGLRAAFGPALMAEMAALATRAPVDLRVNTLKADRPAVLEALKAQGYAAAPTPWSPVGIRIPPDEGAGLAASPLFTAGAIEFQDEAAQIAALLADARPGMAVLDLAAGAGGKTLAMAAAMENRGAITVFDSEPRRLAPLAARARRAGVGIVTTGRRPFGGQLFDRVFVDAPCSGTGTWRRQPELRWRLTADRLAALTRVQDSLLDEAARHVRPGGMILYATCSVLPVENRERVAAFLARQPGLAPVNLAQGRGMGPVPGLDTDFCASPARTGTDGFFVAGLWRA